MRHKTESRKKPQMCCEIKHNAGGKACHWQLACIYTLHCKADGWKEWIKTRWREERCEEELNGNGNVSRWLTDRMKRWLVPIEASNASQFCFDKENAWCLWVPSHLQWRNSTMSIQRAIIIATTFTFFIQAIVWHIKSKIATFNWLCGNCKLWNGRFGIYLLCLGFSQPLASLSGSSLCLLWTPHEFSL